MFAPVLICLKKLLQSVKMLRKRTHFLSCNVCLGMMIYTVL